MAKYCACGCGQVLPQHGYKNKLYVTKYHAMRHYQDKKRHPKPVEIAPIAPKPVEIAQNRPQIAQNPHLPPLRRVGVNIENKALLGGYFWLLLFLLLLILAPLAGVVVGVIIRM